MSFSQGTGSPLSHSSWHCSSFLLTFKHYCVRAVDCGQSSSVGLQAELVQLWEQSYVWNPTSCCWKHWPDTNALGQPLLFQVLHLCSVAVPALGIVHLFGVTVMLFCRLLPILLAAAEWFGLCEVWNYCLKSVNQYWLVNGFVLIFFRVPI